jgi:hypothetical protein
MLGAGPAWATPNPRATPKLEHDMSTRTDTEISEIVADTLDDAAEVATKSSHRLLKFMILLGILGIVFAVVRQMTADSDPEPYQPAS